jgi:prepilin-type processing-associated H-X9-DG protein
VPDERLPDGNAPAPLPYASPDVPRDRSIEPAALQSLICGIVFWLTPIPALLAILFGLVSLRRLRIKPQRGRRAAWAGLLLGIVGCAIWTWIAFDIAREARPARTVTCAANLRSLATMLHHYALEHEGRLPDSWIDLASTYPIQSRMLVCPASSDTPAAAPTTQAIVSAIRAGGHVSYAYLGKGRTMRGMSYKTILAFDACGEHPAGGVPAVFADGHVEVLDRQDFVMRLQALLDQGSPPSQAASTRP